MRRFFLSSYSSEDILTHLQFLVRARWLAIMALTFLVLAGKGLGLDAPRRQFSGYILLFIGLINALASWIYHQARPSSRLMPWAIRVGFFQALADLIGILLGIHYFPLGHLRLSVLFLVLYFGGMVVVFPLPQSLLLTLLGVITYSGMMWAYAQQILPLWDPSGHAMVPSRSEILFETFSAVILGLINGALLYVINSRLQRARKDAELRQEWLTRLHHLTQNGLRSQRLEDLIQQITHKLCELTTAQGSALYLHTAHTTLIVPTKAMRAFRYEDIEALFRSLEEEAQKKEHPPEAQTRRFVAGSVLALPLDLASVRRGYRSWLLLWYPDKQAAQSLHPILLQQIQTTSTLLLSQALTREEWRKKVHILAALAQTAHRLSQTMDLDTLFKLIVEQGCALVNAPRGVLCLISPPEEEKNVICPYARGVSRAYLDYVEDNYSQMPGLQLLARAEETVIHIPDVSKNNNPRLQEMAQKAGFQAITYLRIASPERLLGALILYWDTPYPLRPDEYDALYLFTAHTGTILYHAQMYALLQSQAQTDALTGLYNRRALFRLLEDEIRRTQRHQRPLSLLLIDLNGFKRVNDRFGHGVGDLVLRQVAHYLQHILRDCDIVARYGGDEFVVLLPETSTEEAHQIARRLHQLFRNFTPDTPEPLNPPITLSIGVATYPEDGIEPQHLIKVADQRMYEEKKNNNNGQAVPLSPL